jgi:hypothetical protein
MNRRLTSNTLTPPRIPAARNPLALVRGACPVFGGQAAGPGRDQRGSGSLQHPSSLVNPWGAPLIPPPEGEVPPGEADCTGPVRRRQAPFPALSRRGQGETVELVNRIG